MQLGVLEYLISVNDKGVQEGINKSERTVKASASRADRSLKEYGNKVSAWTIAKGQMMANVLQKSIKTLASTTKQLVKSSVMAYADYEQLVGGVETLFKDTAVQVKKFADEAYKTAGISANEYMETVTSFSASLLQSLENDTDKAADYADMAIRDMADNANKMGSTMESIQNAYQGFAKQNYTMLDNLKLGYGGTKKEMERLLKDAGKLVNRTFSISKLSDVYEAIHIIQQELGIFGTTEKEAAETISGSMNTAKAAWKDLLVSMSGGGDVKKATRKFTDSVKTMFKNIVPTAKTAIRNIFEAARDALPEVKNALSEIWNEFKKDLPKDGFIAKLAKKADDILATFNMLSDLVTNFDETTEFMQNSDSPLLRGFSKVLLLADSLVDDVSKAVEEEDSLLFGLLKGGGNWLTKAIGDFTDWLVGDGAEKIANVIVTAVEKIGELAERLVPALANIVSKVLTNPTTYEAAGKLAVELGKALYNILIDLASDIVSAIDPSWGEAVRGLKIGEIDGTVIAGNGTPNPKLANGVGKSSSESNSALSLLSGNGSSTTGGIPITIAGFDLTNMKIANKSGAGTTGSGTSPIGTPQSIGMTGSKTNLTPGTFVAGLTATTLAGAKFGGGWGALLGATMYTIGRPIEDAAKRAFTEDALTKAMNKVVYGHESSPTVPEIVESAVKDVFSDKPKGEDTTRTYARIFNPTGGKDNIFEKIADFKDSTVKKAAEIGLSMSQSIQDAKKTWKEFTNDVVEFCARNFTIDIKVGRNWVFDPLHMGGAGGGESNNFNIAHSMRTTSINAKGDWNVSYDHYALLHRGEMVLTKSQARKYRQGEETDYDSIGTMIGNAVEKAMSKVYVMMSGEKVGDLTTRRIKRNLNANNFSKLRAYGG